MEEGLDSCSWFNVLDKKTPTNSDFLRWMKRQQQQQQTTCTTGPKVSIMAPHHQQTNPDHPFIPDDDGGGGTATAGGAAAAAADVGPTNKSDGAYEAAASNIYRHQLSSGGGGDGDGGAGGVENFGNNPFDYSPGGEMGRDFAFTAEQWKELERQAMIYKCMISSVPVPPHLLFPLPLSLSLSTNFPSVPLPLPSVYGGARYSRKGDLEPGRCKRTDGKKWRCSREVAPLQKYCDRHLHRGRPRSRKPVELNNNNNTAPNHKKTRTKSPPLPIFKPKTHLTISPPYFNGTNRDLGVMKQPWEEPMEAAEMGMANQGLSDYRSSFDQDYAPLDLFSYPNLPSQEMNLPAGFIGAKSLTSEGVLSPSLNLSMAMAVGDLLDEQMKNIQTGGDDDMDSMWLNPACWEPFARGGGGPLAEALQPGSSNPASPYNSTSVSSPSGVLHRTLFSHSDGSVCNSPTGTFRLIGN